MKFILTIDTEADNQWDHGRKISVKNIQYIPRFQELCNKYSIKPTYLVTSEVCSDAMAQEILTEYLINDEAEIGAHLHSWTTPPFLDKEGYRYNDKSHAFASEIEIELMNQKIRSLTQQIENVFGKKPTSFRSGRYGFNEDVAMALIENDYLVDSSVTPYTRWSANKGLPNGKGGPDFTNKTPVPYSYTFKNKTLVEIPITILPTRFPLNVMPSLAEFYFQNVNEMFMLKVIRKLLFQNQPLWLRPYEAMNNDLFASIIREARRKNLSNIVMMFHSSELMPGCSKYRKDESAVERLYEQLEELFILFKKNKIEGVTLSEAALKYNK